MGQHTESAEQRLHRALTARLAAILCANPLQPCPLHQTAALRTLRQVLSVIGAEGWALRKVYAAPDEDVEDLFTAAEAGDINPRRMT